MADPLGRGGMVNRLPVFVFFFAVFLVLIFVRLWFLQVVHGARYQEIAEGNRIREIPQEAQRGYILDRNGKKMVVNRLALSVFIQPTDFRKLEDKEGKIEELAEMLEMEPEEIAEKVHGGDVEQHKPILIKKDVKPETWFWIAERQMEYPWLSTVELPVRDYPEGEETRAAHILGYMGEISEEQLRALKDEGYGLGDVVGTSGVEAYYESELRGTDGYQSVEVNAAGKPLRYIEQVDPEPGDTLQLTIDQEVQKVAEKALHDGLLRARTYYDPEFGMNYLATAGAAVVLDSTTGEVIAMASEPTFNLKKFVGGIDQQEWDTLMDPANNYPLNNRAIVGLYPPASTFKVITGLASLAEHFVSYASPFGCDGVFNEGEFGDYPKTCWSVHDRVDFTNAIIQSCDVVFYSLGYQFYKNWSQINPAWETRLQDYATLMGLGTWTGIDLPNEQAGRVPTPKWKYEFNQGFPDYQGWYPGDTVNMAVGQGDILVTPIQLANVYAAIANGGPFYQPHVGKATLNWQGEELEQVSQVQLGDITDPDNASGVSITPEELEVVKAALPGVVQGKGTAAGSFARFPLGEIPVAGKTGTAEVQGKQTTAWFACYAPAYDPKYVVVVMIEEGGHGGAAAAPVARRILEQLFGLPPEDYILPSQGD
ncbi:MAG: penicillin-binding protein 2 [Candidatus Geothermincolia bacterium]